MNDQEMEDIVSKLNQRINNKDPNFILDRKTKEVFKKFNFFHQIMLKFPDKGDAIMAAILSNLYIRKYNQFEIIWDDNKKYLKGIFIVLLGVVNVYIYNFQNKSKSNEIKLNMSLKKIKKSKDNNNMPLNLNIKGITMKNSNSVIEDLKPLKIDHVAKKGDSIGNTFLKSIIDKDEKTKYKYKMSKKCEVDNEEIKENKNFYKIESKTKSIIGFLTEDDYNIIFERIIIKERHERMNFLHKINYMPKDQAFIERFQNQIIKKVFFKNSVIFKQNEEFKTFYIITSGSVRLTISFDRQFFCSLDFDVLIGNHINDRFTSARAFEIDGNYKEKESFIVVDLGEGEVIGGIEYCKNMKNYIFTTQCITDVILYEVNLKFFNNILSYWNFQRFFNKINSQLTYFKNRIISINNFRKEKSKKDDYSFSQNKFIQTYKRGHPISVNKEGYIEKFTNPFKFQKINKSKEIKMYNTRYIKDYKTIQNKNETKNLIISNRMPFITNIPNKYKKIRKLKKSLTTINIKFVKKRWEDITNINEENKEKENDVNHGGNKIEMKKKIKKKKILKHSNTTLNINHSTKNVRKFQDRRLKSCKIEKPASHFFIEKNVLKSNDNNNNDNNNNILSNNILILKSSTTKNKNKKYVEKSVETCIKNNMINNESNKNDNYINLYKINNQKNIKKRNNNCLVGNLTDYSHKKLSNILKMSYSANKSHLLYSQFFSPLNGDNRNSSQPQINHKSLVFPSGIQETVIIKTDKMNQMLSDYISNNYIRNELKYKKLNEYILKHNYSNKKDKKQNAN